MLNITTRLKIRRVTLPFIEPQSSPSEKHWLENTKSKETQRLFTIYKQRPVGTRFVQMVSKNSRMGNLVGIGVYHLQNPFKVTERVWREAKSWRNANGNYIFHLEIPFGNFGLPFKKSHFLREFSVWEDQNRLRHSNRNFRIFSVNGEQPKSPKNEDKI